MYVPFLMSDWDPKDKHCFVTGGSQGLGLELAKLLVQRGASVTIVSRTASRLEEAAKEIAKPLPEESSQQVSWYAADVSKFSAARKAFDWASSPSEADSPPTSSPHSKSIGTIPDAVFCCAGGAKPGFFLEQTEQDFVNDNNINYMTAVSTTHAAVSVMAKAGKKGKIVLVSSTLGLFGSVGYTMYCPSKFAIRGLAESLRSELILYDISIHCYFPGTILSPGYEKEHLTKPKIAYEIEGGAENGQTPEACARGLLTGLARGNFFITTDFETELVRTGTAAGGSVPGNFWLWDRVFSFITLFFFPLFRYFKADAIVKNHRSEHASKVSTFDPSFSSKPSRRSYQTLFLLSITHRLLVLSLLLVLPYILRPFDTSANLQLLPASHSTPTILRPLSNMIRWDSLHFLGAASPSSLPMLSDTAGGSHGVRAGGYASEQSLAFQPGLVWLLRLAGYLGDLGDGSTWSWSSAILLTSGMSILASALASVLLYHILLSTLDDSRHAFLAALLSILSPSPSTLVTPTPESFFAFFSLLGLALLSPRIDWQSRQPISSSPMEGGRLLLASVCFAIATAFRANGLLLVGYLFYHVLWERFQHTIRNSLTLMRVGFLLPLAVGVAVLPFVLGQVWAWERFCMARPPLTRRPWCDNAIPTVYNFVQSEYWNVGFLRYWTLSQLPNFALAAPVLLLGAYASSRFYSSDPLLIFKTTLLGWRESYPKNKSHSSSSSPESSTLLNAHRNPSLLPHIHLSTVYLFLLLFTSHVQIALRFASPVWISLWVGATDVLLSSSLEGKSKGKGKEKEEEESRRVGSEKKEKKQISSNSNTTTTTTSIRSLSTRAKIFIAWLVLWQVVSLVLYAAFLPPA